MHKKIPLEDKLKAVIEAFKEGSAARQNNIDRDACPYSLPNMVDREKRKHWIMGWDEAEKNTQYSQPVNRAC